MRRWALIVSLMLMMTLPRASAEDVRLVNPTKRECRDELVRLPAPASAPAGSFIVTRDGRQLAYQIERVADVNWVWICDDFAPGATNTYKITTGKPAESKPRITLRKESDDYVLDNGVIAVKIPAAADPAAAPRGPISGMRLQDKWVGGSSWHTPAELTKFTATVIGDGTLFAKVRLRYEFASPAIFAEIDVALGPGWQHVEITERHEMNRGDYWQLDCSRGWAPDSGLSKPFSGGAGSGEIAGKVNPNRPLTPGGLPVQQPDLYINLLPRWNQHYKDGWFFATTDGTKCLGALAVRASQWVWPHDNSIQCIVRESGDYAGLRAGTWHGKRQWWLITSDQPTLAQADPKYLARYAWEHLDKLNHEFVALEWPGHDSPKAGFPGMNFYDSNQMNPTSSIRGIGRRALADSLAGKRGDQSMLLKVQVMLHGDAYGSLRSHWSPENANFFTDFNKVPIALTAQLRDHPRFEQLRKMAEERFREDMEHSVTLPGGAGQECPGYQAYALKHWTEMAPLCQQYLGFDPTTWDRFKAAQSFLQRIAQPDGEIRRQLPIGDTHPSREGGPTIVEVPPAQVTKFSTDELPGFGVIFNHRAGTPCETYLAFKAGPNRGHYHGDQLAFHLCFNSRAVAVDHHCSYHPRAGQEHMHNRVSFHTDALPHANMDGYERLIAFKTSPVADLAVAQVESNRLRAVTKLPPEIWDQRWPIHEFKGGSLIYRRTIVFVKGAGDRSPDYFVIRDQFWSPESIGATYNLHVRADKMERTGQTVNTGNLTLHCAAPADFRFETLPWSHDNGGRESTQGALLSITGKSGQLITVLYSGEAPSITTLKDGVKIGNDSIQFGKDQATTGDETLHVTVTRDGQDVLRLSGKELDLDRSQGNIGLFIPDAGYPFGDIPDWLIKQRAGGK